MVGKKNEDRTSDGGTQKEDVLGGCCWENQNTVRRNI